MIYALGWKGWVELRRARTPPKVEASEVKHFLNPAVGNRFIMLKQLCFRGGTFLVSLPRRRFTSITRISCPQGSVVRVPAPAASRLKGFYEHASD